MLSFKQFLLDEACWKGYKQYGMKDKGGKQVPNCVPAKEEVELDESSEFMKGVAKRVAAAKSDKYDRTSKLYKKIGFDDAGVYKKMASKQKELSKEETEVEESSDLADIIQGHQLVKQSVKDPKKRNQYFDFIKRLRDKHGKDYSTDIHQSISKLKTEEKSPAWTRSAGKDPEGGLNRKGVASYRRENPGSKLKMAVTTPPSKLKKGSKAAKRRKSFCARMGGMKKRLTSTKTARDPDSRINKALRKWNC